MRQRPLRAAWSDPTDPTEVFPAQRRIESPGDQRPVFLARREPLSFGETVSAVALGVFFGLALTSLATFIVFTVSMAFLAGGH